MWYVKQGYGELVQEKPNIIVRFTYEGDDIEGRHGKMEGSEEIYGEDFFVIDKENICAICGKDKDLARF